MVVSQIILVRCRVRDQLGPEIYDNRSGSGPRRGMRCMTWLGLELELETGAKAWGIMTTAIKKDVN